MWHILGSEKKRKRPQRQIYVEKREKTCELKCSSAHEIGDEAKMNLLKMSQFTLSAFANTEKINVFVLIRFVSHSFSLLQFICINKTGIK